MNKDQVKNRVEEAKDKAKGATGIILDRKGHTDRRKSPKERKQDRRSW
jgi:hypothetical protein